MNGVEWYALHTPFIMFSVTCIIVSLTFILRIILGHTNDHHYCHFMTFGVQVCKLTSWHERAH